MATPKLTTPDQRMLQLVDILKQKGTIRFRQEFCDTIEMKKQNILLVRDGRMHFSSVHIAKACKAYGVNANWVLGLSQETFIQQGKLRFIGEKNTTNTGANKKGVVKRKSS